MSEAGAAARPIRLVVFDFDGTLSDSGEWFLSVIDELAEQFRFRRVSRDEVETLRAMSSREVIRYLGIPWWKLPFIARHVRAMVARNIDQLHLFPGTTPLIERLSAAGYRIAVVTSNAEGNARAILGPENCARIGWFECGSSLWGKARKFRRLLRRSGFHPGETLSIGDETRDIEAARSVGLRTGAVLWGYASHQALTRFHPDLFFETPDDIAQALLEEHRSIT